MNYLWRRSVWLPKLVVALLVMLAPTFGMNVAHTHGASAGPVYGGTIRVAFDHSFTSFDPAQAVGADWWLLNGTLYNGLYQFDRTGAPQLDLAAAPPVVSKDRKTWTFTIRKGVLFQNGMEVTANDFKYSLTRILDPHLQPAISWGQSVDTVFQGAQAYIDGKATSVSGIQVLGRYTIRFVLTQPTAVFPDILAESFNFVVPEAVVSKESESSFSTHPVGTGPFMLQSWNRGVEATFVRNPHYFHPGKPYLNGIIAYENMDPSLIALKIEKGDLDAFGLAGGVLPADLQQAEKSPTYSKYIQSAPNTAVTFIYLNTQEAPLDNLKMRQAIAMAINRNRLTNGGLASPAYQYWIPIMPEYDPTLAQQPIYPYNPQQAAALVKASGYHGQPVNILYYSDVALLAVQLEQQLSQIGLNVTLREATIDTVVSIGEGPTGHQLSFNGWGIDYPDAYDTYTGEFTCSINAVNAGNADAAHYCDPVADSLVNKAESLPLGPARNALFRQVQVRLLKAAAVIPLVYPKQVGLVSPKVGGFYYQPTFSMQYENYWLKQ
jgi:peptide/nickel transport system substrate-binding protein/oligopeptide transport system substrate-binding protein